MKKIENKFIIFVIGFILLIVFSIIGLAVFSSEDRTTSLVVIEGIAIVNDEELTKDTKKELVIGDKIKTIGEDSISVIEWGDGSITRLGGNTYVEINEMYFSENLSQINVSFDLKEGKTWSNIISFFGEESHFKQTFRDNEAAVRGTVYAIDLENDYINVVSHEIEVTSSDGKDYVVPEGKPFSLKNFSFIALEKFIQEVKDKSWESFNKKVDKEFLIKLKAKLKTDLKKLEKFKLSEEKIKNMSDEKKEEIYNDVLSIYQRFNFVDSEDEELFNKKLEYKKYLLNVSDTNNKKDIIRSFTYDFKDSINSKNYGGIDEIIGVLSGNVNILDELNINLADYLNFDFIPDDLKNIFSDNIDGLRNIFGETIDINTFDFSGLKSKGNDIKESINSRVEEFRNRINEN